MEWIQIFCTHRYTQSKLKTNLIYVHFFHEHLQFSENRTYYYIMFVNKVWNYVNIICCTFVWMKYECREFFSRNAKKSEYKSAY
jgi:hypothetical protein